MAEPESILRRHCRHYLRTLRAQRSMNLSEFYCHKRAESAADEAFPLTTAERRKRDVEWLDVKYPKRKVEPPADKGLSLFDDEKIMRAE